MMAGALRLRVEEISLELAGLQVLREVTMSVASGHLVGLAGANGAGKSSLLNVICGYYRPSRGSITIGETDTTRLRPASIAHLGVSRTFQSVGHVAGLSVAELVKLGFESAWEGQLLQVAFRTPKAVNREKHASDRTEELLASAGIQRYAQATLGDCPYGVRKIADLLRAFAGNRGLLLLDEPTSGVSQSDLDSILSLVRTHVETTGTTCIVVDHNVGFLRELCSELVVLASGRVLGSGAPNVILSQPEVIRQFLGTEVDYELESLDPVGAPSRTSGEGLTNSLGRRGKSTKPEPSLSDDSS